MNRIIAIAIATFLPAAATAAEPEAPNRAPRVDASKAGEARAYVRTVGILGMLEDGDATEAVLASTQIGPELDRAIQGLEGQRYASTGLSSFRRVSSRSGESVSIGTVRVSNPQTFQLAAHRGHRVQTP